MKSGMEESGGDDLYVEGVFKLVLIFVGVF